MVEIFATLSSSKRQTARSRTSTGLPVALTPHMNRYAFRAKHVVLRLYRELRANPRWSARRGKPVSRSCILRLGPAAPTSTLLVPTFSLNRPSAGATFPAYPSVNHRRARFMKPSLSARLVTPFPYLVNPFTSRLACGSGLALASFDCTSYGGQ